MKQRRKNFKIPKVVGIETKIQAESATNEKNPETVDNKKNSKIFFFLQIFLLELINSKKSRKYLEP